MDSARAFAISNSVYIAAVAVAAIATFFVSFFGSRLAKEKDAELLRYQTESDVTIAAAKKDAAEAQARAATSNQHAAQAELSAASALRTAESERLARIEIEERVAWRRIPAEERSRIGSKLKRFSGQRASLWFNVGDVEGFTFISDIERALQGAGWSVLQPNSLMTMGSGPVETGVRVSSTEDEASRDASSALADELVALGFDAVQSSRVEKRAGPLVFVTVAVKPETPQGRARLNRQKP
jgi:hypothetical protein